MFLNLKILSILLPACLKVKQKNPKAVKSLLQNITKINIAARRNSVTV